MAGRAGFALSLAPRSRSESRLRPAVTEREKRDTTVVSARGWAPSDAASVVSATCQRRVSDVSRLTLSTESASSKKQRRERSVVLTVHSDDVSVTDVMT